MSSKKFKCIHCKTNKNQITLTLSFNRWTLEAKACFDNSEFSRGKTEAAEIEYLRTSGAATLCSSGSTEADDFLGSNPLTSQFHLFLCSAIKP